MALRYLVRAGLGILVVTVIRCANPGTLQGGPKDSTPPVLTEANPPNLSVFFSASEIQLTFNEYLALKDINKQFLVSPPLVSAPEFKLRRKTLHIRLQDSLMPMTTYSMFFGDAITDLNENNPVVDFQYVFSTGNTLDSLEISGTVKNALTGKPLENALAMLYYRNNDTLALKDMPLQVPPSYIAKTGKSGNFTLRNLRDEDYLLFVIKDGNANYFYDQPGEEIAFLDHPAKAYYKGMVADTVSNLLPADTSSSDTLPLQPYQIKSRKIEYTLHSFLEADTQQRLLKKEVPEDYLVLLVFSKPAENFMTRILPPSDTTFTPLIERNTAGDSLRIWFPGYTSDSVTLYISTQLLEEDTLQLSLKKTGPVRKGKADAAGLQIRPVNSQRDAFQPLGLFFNHPLVSRPVGSITLIENADTLSVEVAAPDSGTRMTTLMHDWKFGTNYQIILPKGTFHDIFGLTHDSLVLKFSTRPKDAYSALKFNIHLPDDSSVYLIQTLDEKENILKQNIMNASGMLDFGWVMPRKLIFRAIRDRNRNGKWDPGNYKHSLQPEEVIYFGKTVEVRANWDLNEEWILK